MFLNSKSVAIMYGQFEQQKSIPVEWVKLCSV